MWVSNWTKRRRKLTKRTFPLPMQPNCLRFLLSTQVKVNRPSKQVPLLALESKRRRTSRLWNGLKNCSKVPLCPVLNLITSLPAFISAGYIPGDIQNAAKTQIFFTILEESIRIGDKMLVFSQSLYTLDLLEEFLKQRFIPGICWCILQFLWKRN